MERLASGQQGVQGRNVDLVLAGDEIADRVGRADLQVRDRAEDEVIVPAAAGQHVLAGTGDQGVVAGTADQGVLARSGGEGLARGREDHLPVGELQDLHIGDGVGSRRALDRIAVGGLGDLEVGERPAEHGPVGSRPAVQHVRTGTGGQDVVAPEAEQVVDGARALQGVVAGAAQQDGDGVGEVVGGLGLVDVADHVGDHAQIIGPGGQIGGQGERAALAFGMAGGQADGGFGPQEGVGGGDGLVGRQIEARLGGQGDALAPIEDAPGDAAAVEGEALGLEVGRGDRRRRHGPRGQGEAQHVHGGRIERGPPVACGDFVEGVLGRERVVLEVACVGGDPEVGKLGRPAVDGEVGRAGVQLQIARRGVSEKVEQGGLITIPGSGDTRQRMGDFVQGCAQPVGSPACGKTDRSVVGKVVGVIRRIEELELRRGDPPITRVRRADRIARR